MLAHTNDCRSFSHWLRTTAECSFRARSHFVFAVPAGVWRELAQLFGTARLEQVDDVMAGA